MLESLSRKLTSILDGLKSKGRLSEEDINLAMREVRMALLEADVNFRVVKEFTENIKQKCLTAEVMESLTPGQNVVKIVLDQLTELLGTSTSRIEFSSRIPNVIMLVGLQGSGKTTAAAKLAYKLKDEGHSPLLVACDIYRPAAKDQLQTLGGEIGVSVYREDIDDAVKIATNGVQHAIDNLKDVVIIDTAGRLHVDEQMMAESKAIKEATEPEYTLMVVDAMTGQDIVGVVQAFSESVDFDGVIMTKMDGDARGGGALSVREVTGKPIKFISSGEKPDSLEEFHPDRIAKRILGMGDMVSLVEAAVKAQEDEEAAAQAEEMAKGNITLNDFKMLNSQVKKMGGISKLVGALPGGDKMLGQGQVNENALDNMEVIIDSMTKQEREKPDILNASRRQRIATGAGVTVTDVNNLIKRYNEMRKMIKKMVGQAEPVKSKRPRKGGGKKKKRKQSRRQTNPMAGLPGGLSLRDLKAISDQMNL
jgi:signal recognition particle subunit SRP54